ncbi:MAG: prepilin-type N-terminal cleavage/methylation domain-containing protein, partial [Kiritimatiellae bacterium]|nr:prepilin-type N-terminal cleavage/methylation domain-containing protein [Kiritimatiellia bacterium]
MKHGGRTGTAGFTLVELMLVVAIIAIIATIAVSQMSRVSLSAKVTAAESDLKTLSHALTDPETGYLRDMRGIPGFSPALIRMSNLLISTNLYGSVEGRDWLGGFRVDDGIRHDSCAPAETFIRWNPESERGWHGPYVRHAMGNFPSARDTRFKDDDT